MPLPRFVARLNKRYTNRFIEPVVRHTPGYAVVVHSGRRSGRSYRTPVYAFAGSEDTMYVALTYGPSADWVQNVLASGGTLERNGSTQPVTAATIVGRETAWPHLPRFVRSWLRILRVNDFLQLSWHST